MKTFELVELDPETGEEDHLIETGNFRKLESSLRGLLADVEDDWDTNDEPWSWYRIQPAS